MTGLSEIVLEFRMRVFGARTLPALGRPRTILLVALILGTIGLSAVEGEGQQPGARSKSRKAEPVRVYRNSDPTPRHDEARLKSIGIGRYTGNRLQLFSDLPDEKARPLPPIMDQLYDAWVEYFGTLPPDRGETEFQMTGYLMVDQRLFRESDLLPEDLPAFPHGRHRGTRFWLNEQPTDYYRRHLLLHEGTHCFMTAVRHPMFNRVWYMEGMAELFATHRIDGEGVARFRVMPHDREQFANLGRIRLIEDEVRRTGPRTLRSVIDLGPDDFQANASYAWAWAACQFLDGHPRYHEPFQRFGRCVTTGIPEEDEQRLLFERFPDLAEEWLLFAANLCHGYDQERAAIDFGKGRPLEQGASAKCSIAADRGWQSSGILVEKGAAISISASGRFVIAEPDSGAGAPRPWESEAQGVSIRYYAGQPLGKLVAVIRSTDSGVADQTRSKSTMLDVIPVGRERRIVPDVSGTLYFRVNDAWNELADNSGKVAVEVRREP